MADDRVPMLRWCLCRHRGHCASNAQVNVIWWRCAWTIADTVISHFSENSTKHTQARAFSYFAFARNLGLFIGPLLGTVPSKTLFNLADKLSKVAFWKDQLPSIRGHLARFSSSTTTHMHYQGLSHPLSR